jgi:hypothetical protein
VLHVSLTTPDHCFCSHKLLSSEINFICNVEFGSVKKIEITAIGDPSRCPRDTLYPQNLVLTPPTSGGRWVGIVRSRTQATEFSRIWILNPILSSSCCIFSIKVPEIQLNICSRAIICVGMAENRLVQILNISLRNLTVFLSCEV